MGSAEGVGAGVATHNKGCHKVSGQHSGAAIAQLAWPQQQQKAAQACARA
jgi:hypothetical protein